MYKLKNKSNSILAGLDWLTIGIYLVLVLFGWINIMGASYQGEDINIFDFSRFYGKQFTWIILSLVLGGVLLILDSKFFTSLAYPIFGVLFVLLLSVFVIGVEVGGAKSWIDIGFMRLQPSEFLKFGTALALAKYLSTLNIQFEDIKTKIVSFAIVLIPCFTIIVQEDAGTALVYLAMVFALYREGLSGNLLLLGFALLVLAVLSFIIPIYSLEIISTSIAMAVFAFQLKQINGIIAILALTFIGYLGIWIADIEPAMFSYFSYGMILTAIIMTFSKKEDRKKADKLKIIGGIAVAVLFINSINYFYTNVLQSHQRGRIDLLFGKIEDNQGIGYNVNQSKIAIGSGGFKGRGFLNGTQTKYKFVPEQRTDFIFCTVGEEWGFLGSGMVIILFVALFLRILFLAERQRSTFSRVYGYCVACILFFHLMINIGMTVGLAPVIGIPLPFFSYGGSSLWSFTVLIFIFLNFDSRRMEIMR